MARLDFAILCRRAVVDKYSNTLSLFEVLETATVPPEKVAEFEGSSDGTGATLDAECYVVTSWSREKFDEPEVGGFSVVEPVGPRGWRGDAILLEVDLQRHKRVRNLFHAKSLPFDGLGEYRFEVFWQPKGTDEKIPSGSIRFQVSSAPAEAGEAPVSS